MASFSTLLFAENISEPVLSQDQPPDSDLSDSDANVVSNDGELLGSGNEEINSGLDSDEEGNIQSNSGWADAMAKILKTNKPKRKKTIVLAKAKKISDVLKREKVEDFGFEIEGELKEENPDADIKPQVEEKPLPQRLKKISWYSKGRQKPNVLDKDRERTLAKIGTKGVVQLFNAVKQQQKMIESKLEEVSAGPAKREKILKTIDKKAFLEVVMGSVKSQTVDGPVKEEKEAKVEDEDTRPAPTWQVLREDFMMGGRYKDWDRSDPAEEAVVEPMEEESDSESD